MLQSRCRVITASLAPQYREEVVMQRQSSAAKKCGLRKSIYELAGTAGTVGMEPRYKATAPLNMSVQLTLGHWPRERRSSNWEIDVVQQIGYRRATDLIVM